MRVTRAIGCCHNGNNNDTITAIPVIASSLPCEWKEEGEGRSKCEGDEGDVKGDAWS